MAKEEVMSLAKKGKESGCTEALITCGERPEEFDMVREKLEEWNYESFLDYIVDISKEILNLNLLPHTNLGVLKKGEIKRLKKWNASMGLMLESGTELEVHKNSPGKNPETRLQTIKNAGEAKIPFTTGILVGIGENWQDRTTSLLKIRKLHERYGHIQEVIIQPFIPKDGTPMNDWPKPNESKILNTILSAKSMMPDVSIQVPPNLITNYKDTLLVGVRDFGGISSVTPDFVNPDMPWPEIETLRKKLKNYGFRLRERLPIYPSFTKNSDFMSPEIESVVKSISGRDGYRRQNS